VNPPAFLAARSVSRHFGGHRAVDDVSFDLPQGILAGLIGPNGAGKTTLFNLVAGALPLTSGEVRLQGKTVRGSEGACALGIARTFQNVRLFPELTVLENVMTGMGGYGFWQGALRLPALVQADRLRMKRAFYLLEDVGVADLADHPASGIPFGQQRLVEIARALALQPKLLLLDEPAAGLNATETARLGGLIRRLHDRGITVLLVEHDMALVMNLAERVIVLDQGRVIADGSPSWVRADDRVRTAYLGKEAPHA
jgi:branched-chain amino acid transport system ATP-binding protein